MPASKGQSYVIWVVGHHQECHENLSSYGPQLRKQNYFSGIPTCYGTCLFQYLQEVEAVAAVVIRDSARLNQASQNDCFANSWDYFLMKFLQLQLCY